MKLFRKIRGKLGFTLAEMLIVVAILAILTAVAAPNVAKYSRSINLRELNDSARAIYMAAEHKFMNEIEMGRTLPDGAPVNTTALENRYGGEASAVNVKYLKSSEEPLKKLMTSGSAAGDSTGVIESQLYDNNYIVEYNPETGDVFGVFYSEDDNLSGYEANCYPYIAEMQKEKLIGYYGSDNVKPEEKTNSKVLPKPEVEIINKEKLVVRITAPEVSGGEPISIKVKVNDTWIVPETGYNIVPGTTVDLILDSLISSGKPTIATTLVNSYEASIYEASIADWLGAPVEDCSDMTLTVTFYDKDGKTRDQSVTKTFNPLFANGSTADTAYIEYGRHLQNLDKCEAIHNVIIKKTIDFKDDDPPKEYEHWHDVYGDRQFTPITNDNIVSVKGEAGVEIRYLNCSSVQNTEDGYITVQSCLFNYFSGTSVKDLTFYCPTLEARKGTTSGVDYRCFAGVITGYAGYSENVKTIENVKVINPDIESDGGSGGIIGQSDSQIDFDNCSVYVETNEKAPNWGDPEKDPYSEYKIHGENYGGGIAGTVSDSNFTKCYASVKVSGLTAGGLVGNITTGSKTSKVTSCFVGGHTYEGKFKGTATIGGVEKQFNLTDNVSGKTASGLIGEVLGRFVFGSADVEIENSFATCSVSGTNVDPLYQIGDNNGYKAKVDIKGDNVYTLGTAYKDNGDGTFTEIKKSADTNVKTGDDVKVDDSSATVGKRYDLKVSSVYKYKLPTTGMTMHGDWPSSDAVTGFFYWEKEVADTTSYHFHVLWYGNGKPDELKIPAASQLCKEQDGHNVTDYGYGAFSVGGSLDSAVTFCDGTDDVTIDEREEDAEKTVEAVTKAIRTALAGVPDLKITDSGTVAVKLYNVTGVSGKTFVTATVGGNEYTFAPDFYAIYASKDSVSVGTAEGVLGVRSEAHLAKVGSYLSEKFVQSHDIKPAAALTPIGTSSAPFTGTYNGGSYRIINAKINSTAGSDYAGLFGVTDGAKLENIVMFVEAAAANKFVEIKGKTVGVIVGNAENASGEITNCVAAGYTVIGSENSGGIAGVSACPITNCEANIRFGKVQNVAGSIVGNGENSEITNCYALVHGIESPKSSMTLGGIAGKAKTVKDCYVIFAGQTVGYPVAESTVLVGNNYFVYDVGYCSIGNDSANSGTKVLLEENDDTEYPLLKSVKNAITGQISYSDKASPCDSTCQYEYAAVVDDKVAGHLVHYGPFPEASSGELITGPIAGIYHLKEYLYNSEMTHSGQFDGYLGYNKNGVLFFSEADLAHSTYPQEYIGVFLEKTYEGKELSINDPRIEIKIDGKIIDKSKIKKFEEYYNVTGKWILAYYPFFSKHNIQDHFTQMGTDVVEDVQDKFNFYVLFEDDGSPIDYSSKTIIQILFKPDGKPKGVLIEGYKNHGTTKNNLRFAGSLPTSGYDEDNTPRVGALLAQRRENNEANSTVLETYDSSKPYYIKATIGNTNLGGEGGWGQDYSRIGILIHKDDVAEYESGRLKIALDKVFVELKPWDEVTNYATFANKNILDGYEDYRLFVVDEDRAYGHPMLKEDGTIIRDEKGQIIFNNVTNLAWTFDFIYGTKKFLAYANNGGLNPQEFTESLEYVLLKD